MTAITAFRSLTMTEILSVPVPTQPAVAVERPVTHHSLGIRSDRNDEQVDTRHLGGAILTPALCDYSCSSAG